MDKEEKIKKYSNKEITVLWKPKLCIHAGVCVQLLPQVYKPDERPWINIENASTEELKVQIDICPTSALSYYNNDGNRQESKRKNVLNKNALHKISYGMYILSSGKDDKYNGQIVNAVIQATSDPATVAVCVNRDNLTHELVENSKVFTLSILSEDAPMNLIGNFGFKSGRDINKFEGVNFKKGQNGVPIVLDSLVAFLEFELINQMDMGSHTMFVGKVTNRDILSDENPMTYAYYHNIKGGKSPKSAPHYIEDEEGINIKQQGGSKMDKYVCETCGYVYDPEKGDQDAGIKSGTIFEDLPDDWVCPTCGVSKNEFEKK